MTNEQLYLAIGVPLLFNGLLIGAFWMALNKRIDSFETSVNRRLDRIEDLLRDHDRDIAALKQRESPTGRR